MRKLPPPLLGLSALAFTLAILVVPGTAAAVGSTAARKPCPRGTVHAIVAGAHRCLRTGQRCSRRHDRTYHRYGFHCHKRTLTRRRQARAKPPRDLTPPETAVAAGPASPTSATDAAFAFSADEAGASFACSLDGSAFAPCSSPQAYGGLAEGGHRFEVRAGDRAGNIDPTPAGREWTVDLTPPETAVAAGPAEFGNTGSAEFAFSASEPGSTFECRLDEGWFSACASPLSYLLLAGGAHTFSVRATDAAGNADVTPAERLWTVGDPVVAAAGDIACQPGSAVTATKCRHQATSNLLTTAPRPMTVLTLGDHQYEDALYSEFMGEGAYDATWGRKKSITKPVPGNHEYHVAGAPGYFEYFGAAAGGADKGYYSFDIGSWHLVALNSEITHTATSAQVTWLKQDLAATTERCILAYWHKPRFSSGYHGGSPNRGPLWNALYAAGADVVLNGHDHNYERFALQSPAGLADAAGIREFVVGTGGASHSSFGQVPQPNSELREASTYGVLKLTLHESSYDWQFVPELGRTFTDSGSSTCH